MGCGGSKEDESKIKIIFVIGGPGCKKGTICKKLEQEFGYIHMPIRDILKSIVINKMGDNWEELLNDVKKGKSISSEKLLSYIKIVIINSQFKKILLDGFPRNIENLNEWNNTMSEISIVIGLIYFEVTEEIMKKKLIEMNEENEEEEEEEEEEKEKEEKKMKEDKEKLMDEKIQNFINHTKPIIDIFNEMERLITVNASIENVIDVYYETKTAFKDKKWHKN